MKVSIQVSFAPKTQNFEGVKQVLHSEQATGLGLHCREILFIPRCSPRAREFGSIFLYDIRLRSYGATKLPNFQILAYFPHTKPVKVPSGDQPTAQGLHRRMIPIFPRGSRRSKGVPSGTGVFLRLLVGQLWIPKLPNFCLWQVAIPILNAAIRRVRSGPKMF